MLPENHKFMVTLSVWYVLLAFLLFSGCAARNHTHDIDAESRLMYQLNKWKGRSIESFKEHSITPVTEKKKVGRFTMYQTSVADTEDVIVQSVVFTVWFDLNLLCASNGIIIDVDVSRRLEVEPLFKQGKSTLH